MEKKMSVCPVCDGEITVDSGVEVSEIIRCGDCGSDLEIESVDPLTLIEAPQEEEDWGE